MVFGKKYILSSYFVGEPKSTDLTLVDFETPPVKDGEILAEAEYFTVDPYMRVYSKAISLGDTMVGNQVSKILESKNPNWPVGKRIVGSFGWSTHAVFNPDKLNETSFMPYYILPDFDNLPTSLGLGMLGMPGNTAYFGFLEICKPKAGETVVISTAAGAVGSHVGQIAKIYGLKVIGITGSDAKCKWIVDELGFDHAINYKTQDVGTELENAAPDGVDCYFDNVGGEISSIVIHHMRDFGRVSVCGSISAYNDSDEAATKATILQKDLVFKQIKMEGFMVLRWKSRWMEGIEKNLSWIREGKLIYKETVTQGFENMFHAFAEMLKGKNIGKAIVKV